eukprot:GFUD01013656.1.p1 GENE.GFUD01013656.1~~GFUD01013656.1.p1  ORF type:complete len:326 (+),score=77.09 GFUD01013656.1:43-1020(+)
MDGGTGEKFCLRWNDFENNISKAFGELRDDKDFFDVTIACDDSQLQAHKVILSACSPFFRSVFKKNPHQHPLLYLKGVKYADILSVLNFMYHGEVNVAQEELNSFLAVAEDLQVKGLTQNQSNQPQSTTQIPSEKIIDNHGSSSYANLTPEARPTKQTKMRPSYDQPPTTPTQTFQPKRESQILTPQIKTEVPSVIDCDLLAEENTQQIVDAEEYPDDPAGYEYDHSYDETLQYEGVVGQSYDNDNMQGDYDFEEFVNQNSVKRPDSRQVECLLCNKITIHIGNMKQHFEVNHFHRTYKCEVCLKNFKTRNSLDCHKKRFHRNLL